ncbi:MAG: hypothetical protein O3A47_01745 [Chloroflexi bacterium]|nr:hypothetical protein [Chloroflexota bacterium]
MIWIRRAFTVPLGLLLFVLVLVALVLLQVSDSFIKPSYYAEELDDANLYEFVLVDLLTSALDEARALEPADFGDGIDSNPIVSSGLTTEDIVSSINRALPPEFLQQQVEQVLDELGRYIAGERDDFQVTILAGEQARVLVEEVSALLRKSDAYNVLFDEVITPAADDALDEELPFGLQISGGELVESARRVVPREWVQEQIDAVLDETVPYFLGESDTFEIRIALADRIDLALIEVKNLLRKVEAYDLLYDEIIEPEVQKQLGDAVDLPFGFSITNQEVLRALRTVAPPDWVQSEAERLIDEVGPYLAGETDSFAINVSLADNKRVASEVVLEIATRKFTDALTAIPDCTLAQLARFDLASLSSLPVCIPSQLDPDLILDQLGGSVSDAVDSLVLGAVPDDFLFTEANLRDTLVIAGAEDNLDLIDDVREIIRDGWTYSEEDMRADLIKLAEETVGFADSTGRVSFSAPDVGNRMRVRANESGQEGLIWVDFQDGARITETTGALRLALDGGSRPGAVASVVVSDDRGNPVRGAEVKVSDDEILDVLDDVRAYLADGWTYETLEFRDNLKTWTDEETVENFDKGRDYLSQARGLRLLVYLPMLLVLIAIGFLGGLSWAGRVGWGAAYLAGVAAIVFIAFGPVYNGLTDRYLDDARDEAYQEISFDADFGGTQRLAVDKAFDVAESVVDGFASGIAGKALLLVFIALITVGASIFWATIWAFVTRLRSGLT